MSPLRVLPLLTAVALSLVAVRPAGAQTPDYVVGPQDVLWLAVWDQADLSGSYTVEADGTFAYPLLGRVRAAGLTLRQLEQTLKTLLAAGYVRDPRVSASVQEYRSQMVFVVGEVQKPGSYPLSGQMTLIEAIARAGSTTERAGGVAVITHAAAGSAASAASPSNPARAPEVIRIDLKDLQNGVLSQNVVLRGGETVFVPRAETVYVLGEVTRPGTYAIQKDTTVLQALALAGGVSDRGSTKRVRIIRLVEGKRREFNAKMDDVLQPGDTIVVLERLF